MRPTHVVFGHSAAKDLRDALAEAGKDDNVLAFPDNLSLGPINPPSWHDRAQWMSNELLYEARDLSAETEAFWTAALAPGTGPVAWMSRRSAHDYANFLEWLWRLQEVPCKIIDLTEVKFLSRSPDGDGQAWWFVVSLALIPSKTIRERGLWDYAVPLSEGDRQHYRRLWGRLKEENAPLRIIRDGELASASIDAFDQTIMPCVQAEWRKISRVVGEVLYTYIEDERQQVGDRVLHARIRALVAGGLLEGRGDLSSLRAGEVRLPTASREVGKRYAPAAAESKPT